MTAVDVRSTRAWRRLVAYVLERDHRICWLCGHPGADTGDHVLPVRTHPHLAMDPANVRAAHGAARPELGCIGNYGRTPAPRTPPPPAPRPPSRKW